MNKDYPRVMPRDLFNESKLLKCMGRLMLLIHDDLTPKGVKMGYDERYEEPFEIALMDEGALTITNLKISVHKRIITFKTIYNRKDLYPLFAEYDYVDYTVFDDNGNWHEEFLELCNLLKK